MIGKMATMHWWSGAAGAVLGAVIAFILTSWSDWNRKAEEVSIRETIVGIKEDFLGQLRQTIADAERAVGAVNLTLEQAKSDAEKIDIRREQAQKIVSELGDKTQISSADILRVLQPEIEDKLRKEIHQYLSEQVRLIGEPLNTEGLVTKENAAPGWLNVPYDRKRDLEVELSVKNEKETYLVVFTYRSRMTSPVAHASSAITVSGDGIEERRYHTDGMHAERSSIELFGASGNIIITGLPAGEYVVKVQDYVSVQLDRKFIQERQLAIFRLG